MRFYRRESNTAPNFNNFLTRVVRDTSVALATSRRQGQNPLRSAGISRWVEGLDGLVAPERVGVDLLPKRAACQDLPVRMESRAGTRWRARSACRRRRVPSRTRRAIPFRTQRAVLLGRLLRVKKDSTDKRDIGECVSSAPKGWRPSMMCHSESVPRAPHCALLAALAAGALFATLACARPVQLQRTSAPPADVSSLR
jgi:hypothetical protein